MSNNTLTQLNLGAVKELDDEVAATCSGGVGRKGGNDPDVILYDNQDFTGRSLNLNASTSDGDPNIGLDDGRVTDFNDKTSSIKILRGRWIFFDNADYGGQSTGVLGPGNYYLGANNDRITSAYRLS